MARGRAKHVPQVAIGFLKGRVTHDDTPHILDLADAELQACRLTITLTEVEYSLKLPRYGCER